MTLAVHKPYPGVALVVTERGSVLLGAPADAFKATKSYCTKHQLPFPRVLVAPSRLLVGANPQFAPEFFLYDFLFVYGAAFKPELAAERLQLVLDPDQVKDERRALQITLTGPTRQDLSSFKDHKNRPLVDPRTVKMLADVSEHLAIKKGDRPRELDDMIETPVFDARGEVDVLGGHVRLTRQGTGFLVRAGGEEVMVDLSFEPPVVPFASLPVPSESPIPLTFGVKALGTRSGFDLSGPTTGFLFWVNGRAVIYDGPVGTRYLLERQGITFADVDAVVLSHCHEDHMGAFVELILAGHRPRVYTAEPIYRSVLVKLAHHFRMTDEQVAGFIDYHRVTPGEPIEELGATFEFFYTVHTLPTIGMAVSMRGPGGQVQRVQISGDTMHHEGLDKMHAAGVIDAEVHRRMKNLVPEQKVDGGVYLADVGEAIIHGHPKDWKENPNRVLYYHCPDNDHTRSFGKEIAEPGHTYTFIEAPSMHPAVPGRLLHALKFLDLQDPAWFANILFRGRSRKAAAGEVLIAAGDKDAVARSFSVIVSGTALVRADDKVLATLRPGEFFGLIELVDKKGRQTATIVAETPMEIFDIDATLFHDYIASQSLEDTLQKLWTQRPLVESAQLFRSLDNAVKNQLARLGIEESFAPGKIIVEQGSRADDFFVLVEGEVSIEVGDTTVRVLSGQDADNFFGEVAAISPNRQRTATVRAKTAVRALRVRGEDLRKLFEGDMGVRYALVVALNERDTQKAKQG